MSDPNDQHDHGNGKADGGDTPSPVPDVEINPGGFDPITGSLKQSFDEVFGDAEDTAEIDGDSRPQSGIAAPEMEDSAAGRLHPATEQMLSQMPPLLSRGVIYAVAAFIVAALIWSSIVTTDVVVRGQTVIVAEADGDNPAGQVMNLHARTTVGAVISQLHARAGDVVKAGDLLVTLEVQDLERLKVAMQEAELDLELKRRALDRLDNKRLPELQQQLQKLDDRRTALMQIVAHNATTVQSLREETATQLAALEDEVAARKRRKNLLDDGVTTDVKQYEQQRAQLRAQRDAAASSVERLQRQATAAKREYDQFRDAEAGGVLESTRLNTALQNWLAADNAVADARDQVTLLTLKEKEIDVQIEQVRSRNALAQDDLDREILGFANQRKAAEASLKIKLEEYDRLDAQSRADIADGELQAAQLESGLNAQREDLLREIDRAGLRLKQARETAALDAAVREVRAPIDGELTFVGPQSIGEFVSPGQHLATVAGPQAKMVALITLQNRDVANIKPGQSIKFKFDAWNFQTFGVVNGEVISVSPDAISPDRAGGGGSGGEGYVYVVRATFDRNPPARGSERISIRYGMTATAEIVQRTRRVIDILIEPFKKLSENFVP